MDHAMNCDQIERDEIAEKYTAGTLTEGAAEAFEEHYFRCAACLERLELVQNAAVLLRQPSQTRRVSYTMLALAAGLVIAVAGGLAWKLSPGAATHQPVSVARVQPPPNPWADLGRFDAPAYREARLRGQETGALQDFQAGIAEYQQGNYARAVPILRRAAEADPADVRARYFLGVSQLMAGDLADGIEALRRVDAMGLTAYQEEARFYQGKALLQQGDAAGARRMLEVVVAMRGDWQAKAAELLTKLPR